MNPLQRLYDYKSSVLDYDQKVMQTEYFRIIDQIKSRPNQYSIPPEKIIIKRNAYEPFKDPDVINSNKKFNLKISTMIDEPTFPKLNLDYLDMRKKLKRNKEIYRDIAKIVLTQENEKFQDRVFNQKPRIENTNLLLKDYEQSQVYKNLGRNSNGLKKYYREKTNILILPVINKQKGRNEKDEKLFQTEINNNTGSNDNEKNINESKELKEHKYDEISHQKQGHLEG